MHQNFDNVFDQTCKHECVECESDKTNSINNKIIITITVKTTVSLAEQQSRKSRKSFAT